MTHPKRLSQEDEGWLGMAPPPRPPRPELKASVLARAVARRRRAAVTALSERVAALGDTLDLVRGRHTRIVQIPVTTGGRLGYITILEDTVSHRWLVRCENLAPNEPDQAYQFWFVTETGVVPAKLMPMDTDEPMIMVLDMPGGSAEVTGAAMSIEPRTGSPDMTGPTVFKRLL